MSIEACNLAIKNTLNEIRNVCPDISHSFVFRENGEILAADENTTEVAVNNAQEIFRTLAERATVVGGIGSVTFGGTESKVNIIRIDDLYIATVYSNSADEKVVSNLTRVMIPTTFKIMQNTYQSIKNQPQELTVNPKPETCEPVIFAPEIQASEFTVENLTIFGGFLNDPETAYIDRALIVQWAEIYGDDQQIKKIILEDTSSGKITQCKFRPFRDTKYENKGIIQLSEKIQTALNIKKGSHVLVKPVLETKEDPETVSSEKTENPEETIETPKPDVFKGFKDLKEYTQDAPVTQVMVQNFRGIGGLRGKPDYVRIDKAIIARWNEMFGDKEIKEVTVEETIFGEKVRCKFQAIKNSELKGKGVIQLPEKLQQTLQTKEGALVLIKPVLDENEE